jgi:hypothetical protein
MAWYGHEEMTRHLYIYFMLSKNFLVLDQNSRLISSTVSRQKNLRFDEMHISR